MEASGGSDPPPRPGRRSSLEDAHDEEAARRRVSLEDPYVEAQQGEEDDGVAEAEAVVEAAAQELEARLAMLRQYSNWRLNTRQYPSSPYLEQAYASWALRQTASGGLSLVLPPAVLGEEDEEEEEDEDGAGGVHLSADEEGEAAAEQDGPAPPLGSHHHEEHLRRGEALESAIDEIQAYMSKRASQVWSRSASLAEMAAASGGTGGRTSLSPVPLPVDKRVIGAGTVAVPSGVEGGGGGRDSLALRASLLAGAAGRAAVPTTTSTSGSKLWLARQRWLWAVGDYALGLFVFVLLSVTWWRGAWNLFDFYVFPRRRGLRIVTLIAGGAAANAAAFLLYGPTRAWGRRMHRPTEAWVYGTVKRLLVLVRMVASVANWTGCWGLLDAAFCTTDDDDSCQYHTGALWAITGAGLTGLLALRQLNYTCWGPPFAVSLDFQCELVLDTSLRFGTHKEPIHDALSLLRRTGDIIATQWVPDVTSTMAWYGVYTWLPLEFKGRSIEAQLTYVAVGVAIALGAYAMQFILAGFVERYYPSSSTKHRSTAAGGNGGRSSSTDTHSINSSGGNGGPIHRREEESGGGVGKYLAEVLLYLSAFAASNVIWVFFWDFLDEHLLTANYELSNWLCVLVALPLEFALNMASTEVAGGIYLDGAGQGTSGFFFPICYLGEVAAYHAALQSAATYTLYRRSTTMGLGGLGASIGASSSRSLAGMAGGRKPARCSHQQQQQHHHHASLSLSALPSSRKEAAGRRRESNGGLGRSMLTDLSASASASGGSLSESGVGPTAALLRHHSSLSPDSSPVRESDDGRLLLSAEERRSMALSNSGGLRR